MDKPVIEDAPGHIVRPVRGGWEVRWQARRDLVLAGYKPKSVSLWKGAELSDAARALISDRCKSLQHDMLIWGRGGMPIATSVYTGTIKSLITCYLSDKDSTYHGQRFATRKVTQAFMRRIEQDMGEEQVRDINARFIRRQHEDWSEGGKIAMAHGLIGRLRTLFSFGMTILEDEECERLCTVLGKLRFAMPQKRVSYITAEQATAVRRMAHTQERHSVALAQAIQFETLLRQKDVIGEYVPHSEKGVSDVVLADGQKWLRGIRWSEIDANLILRHVTSKRGKELVVDLRLAPMVMEELRDLTGTDEVRRDLLPASGPVVVQEESGLPYPSSTFRHVWRRIARLAGVPDDVCNMDSRAGGISEATNAGADLEHVRHAATHSNITTTQGYSRSSEEKVAKVQRRRIEYRNKSRTEPPKT